MGSSASKQLQESQLNSKDFVVNEKVGEGGFGLVHRITFKKPFKGYTEAAAKTIFDLKEDEVKIMSKLDHRNIVKLLGFCQCGHVDMIVMEFARQGSLHQYLKNTSNSLPVELKRKWIRESALAVQYLHKQSVLHRDIKPQNCLIFQDDLLKLCDFGVAREIDHSQTTSSQKGTYRYMAPEIHRENERGRVTFSKPSDVYAYGMLMLEIISRKPPFHGWEWQAVVFKVASGAKPAIPEDCPEDLKNIMLQCCNHSPKQRPTMEEIVDVVCEWLLLKTIIPEQENHRKQSVPHHAIHLRRVTCLPDGDMVVVDRSKIYILDSNGWRKTLLTSPAVLDRDNQIGWVWGVALSREAPHRLVVVDDRRYAKVLQENGEYLTGFSTALPGEQIINPDNEMSVAIDTDDNILVGNSSSSTVAIHSKSDGRVLNRIKCTMEKTSRMVVNSKKEIMYCSHPTNCDHPKIIAIDHQGNEVFAFTPIIDECMSTGKVVEAGGIICDVCNNIYVSLYVKKGLYFDPYTGHIHKYSSTGSFLGCLVNGLYHPLDLAMASDSLSMFVANHNSVLVLSLVS